jgi:nicotinate dehydrogenase subunit A
MTAYSFSVNGTMRTVESEADMPLLYALRNHLKLTATKFGCGLGQCGACTVLIDGAAARACALPVRLAEGRDIVTLEGLGAAGPDPLQQAFVRAQAAQCGYCIAGMIMTAKAFLAVRPDPSEAEVREALRYNLCRCGTHIEIVRAVIMAADIARANAAS